MASVSRPVYKGSTFVKRQLSNLLWPAVCASSSVCIPSVIHVWHSWLASGHLVCEISYLQTLIVTCDEHRIQVAKQTAEEAVVVILVVAMCDGHAVQNGGRHPALQQQQPQQSQGEDGPLAALARCGALAAAGNGCTTATGKSIQRPPPPPARVATGSTVCAAAASVSPATTDEWYRRLYGRIRIMANEWASDGPVEHVFAECRAVLRCHIGIEYRRRY